MGVCTSINKEPNMNHDIDFSNFERTIPKVQSNKNLHINSINNLNNNNNFNNTVINKHNINTNNNNTDKKSKFVRQRDKYKTVNPQQVKVQVIENKAKEANEIESLTIIEETQIQKPVFQRRDNRSISLIEKNKLGSGVFKEEMKLKVTINTIIEETSGLPTRKYKVVSKLGDGSYGTVYLANNIMTKATVAMKKIHKVKENEVDDMEIKNEIDILRKLDHPNIVKIIEFYSAPRSFYIITDFCACGELYNQIKNEYNENQLAVLFYQVFSGLCYLHANNICHRDLKLENILISEIERDQESKKKLFWIKIIDFGCAKIFEKNKSERTVVGSSYYIAPEVFQHKYNEKCDTWSAGVILYMLIVGRAPFDGADDNEIISSIKKGKYNANHRKLVASSEEVQDLVSKLLEVNVSMRFSAEEALKHSWFKKFNGKSLYSNIEPEKIKMYLQRLINYQINSKLQQMVLAFIVHNVPDSQETKDILKIFRVFNTNDDGKLSKEELLNGLLQYEDKDKMIEKIDDLFFLLDGSNTGYVEYEEFLRACIDKEELLNDQILAYAFNFFDNDNSNRISVNKIKKHFVDSSVSEEVFRSIFEEIDINKDGNIDFIEFKNMMLGI